MNIDNNKIKEFLERTNSQCNRELAIKTSGESFISLGIKHDLRIANGKSNDEFQVDELINHIENIPFAILGGPGVGKSTLLLKLTEILSKSFQKYKLIPIFVHFGLITDYSNLKEKIYLPDFDLNEKEFLWKNGLLCIIFDGINESEINNIKFILESINDLYKRFPKCKYIISCRTIEFPDWASKFFTRCYVQPVTDIQIKNQFNEHINNGNKYYIELTNPTNSYLLDICRIPLLLSMIIKILKSNIDHDYFSLNNLQSKGAVYKEFHKRLICHQKNKETNNNKFIFVENEILCTVAYYMQAKKQVYIESQKIIDIIRDMTFEDNKANDYVLSKKNDIGLTWYDNIFEELNNSPFINLYKSINGVNYICFIHQSFQEYFAGKYISDNIRNNNYSFIDYLLKENSKKNWETIKFANDLIDEYNLINYLLKYSFILKNPSTLILSSNCISSNIDRNIINHSAIDDCCILLLDSFKYWSKAYNYELIYAANKIYQYTSSDFPTRLNEDIKYFSKKYTSGYIPKEYPNDIEFEFLKQIINATDINSKCDSIYSIGKRNWGDKTGEVLSFLFSLLKNNSFTCEIKAQLIKSIKDIIENYESNSDINTIVNNELLQFLFDVICNPKESGKIRTYALNTVASLKKPHALHVFMNYLENKNNPYRDSASWSLQELWLAVKNNQNIFNDDQIHEFYYKCLINESKTTEGMYAKGNLVYTLSKFSAVNYIDKIIEWLQNETSPYVQEDGINAIGVLSNKTNISFIKKYIGSSDPVVTAKAIESLNKLDYHFDYKEEQNILNNRYLIVQYQNKKLANDFIINSENTQKSSLERIMNIIPKRSNDEKKIIQQIFNNTVGTVINN